MEFLDQAGSVREGEDLNAKTVETYLKDSIPGLEGDLQIRQFPGGYSNLTYLLHFGDRELVLRRPPFGTKAKSAHDMGREYRVLSKLHQAFPYCPKPLLYTEDVSITSEPFYVMERIQGIILRREIPEGLSLSGDTLRRLGANFIRVLAELHAVDYESIGLGELGRPKGYVQRQVEGWIKRYRNARTPDAPDCERVMEWVMEHMPPDSAKSGIIHNDYRFDNVIIDPKSPERIIGVLDWEMATLGDPLMDFGNSVAYWVEPGDPEDWHTMRLMPVEISGVLSRKDIVSLYERESGRSLDNMDFYHCFGLFRFAVIFQQIYYRYYHGETKDERFKTLIKNVHVLDDIARWVIDRSNL